MKAPLLILNLILIIISNSISQKCNAVTFQAGGDRGSYQAGAIFGLTRFLSYQTDYNVVTGISVGAINTFGLALTARGNMTGQANILADLWSGLTASDVFISWEPFGILQGLFYQSSLLHYVLQNHLKQIIKRAGYTQIKRNIQIAACNASSGKLVQYQANQGDPDIDSFIYKVKASASLPAVFNPTIINGTYFIDGGTIETLPASQAINRCLELGYSLSDINHDILMVHGDQFKEPPLKIGSIVDVLDRVKKINNYYSVVSEILRVMYQYPEVNFRYLIMPKIHLDGGAIIPTNFTQAHIQELIARGDVAAWQAIRNGEGTEFKKLAVNMGVTDHSSKDELLGGLKHARHKRGIVYVDGKGKKLE